MCSISNCHSLVPINCCNFANSFVFIVLSVAWPVVGPEYENEHEIVCVWNSLIAWELRLDLHGAVAYLARNRMKTTTATAAIA